MKSSSVAVPEGGSPASGGRSGFARNIGRRLVWLVAVVLIVTFIIYWLLDLLPGDTCEVLLGAGATEEFLEECRDENNFGSPLVVRYGTWLGNALTGDFGELYLSRLEVSTALGQKLPATLWLVLYTMIITLAVSVPLGMLAAYKRGSWADSLVSSASFGFIAVPAFVLGLLLILLFSVRFDWFPLGGYAGPTSGLIDHWKSLALPAVTLATGAIPIYVRLLRADMIQNLEENYAAMVKAKGMPTRTLLFRHMLRPSSFTLVTIAGINLAQLINSTIVVEFIFDIDGVGSFLITSVLAQEYLVVQTVCALIATVFVAVNVLLDILYPALDPRVRRKP